MHKDTVVVCVRTTGPDGRAVNDVRTFGTTTRALLELADWLAERCVTSVAMESTGVYWKPVWNLLEGRANADGEPISLMLVNARHMRNVPGRKTDVKDCQWIAQLLAAGLLSPSFVPERPQRELRDLTRQRAQLIGDKTRFANRLQKVLEDANVKLASVASDVLGVSGAGHPAGDDRGQAGPGRDGRAGPGHPAAEDPRPGRGAQGRGQRPPPRSCSRRCWSRSNTSSGRSPRSTSASRR